MVFKCLKTFVQNLCQSTHKTDSQGRLPPCEYTAEFPQPCSAVTHMCLCWQRAQIRRRKATITNYCSAWSICTQVLQAGQAGLTWKRVACWVTCTFAFQDGWELFFTFPMYLQTARWVKQRDTFLSITLILGSKHVSPPASYTAHVLILMQMSKVTVYRGSLSPGMMNLQPNFRTFFSRFLEPTELKLLSLWIPSKEVQWNITLCTEMDLHRRPP